MKRDVAVSLLIDGLRRAGGRQVPSGKNVFWFPEVLVAFQVVGTSVVLVVSPHDQRVDGQTRRFVFDHARWAWESVVSGLLVVEAVRKNIPVNWTHESEWEGDFVRPDGG